MEDFYTLIQHYGYVMIFFGVMLGTTGIPFPSAVVLLTAGAMVQQGHLDLGGAVVFGILGAILGNQVGYWIGYKGGRQFVLKWGRYVKLTPARLERVERYCERHGGKAVFAARFFSVSRVLGALVAGPRPLGFTSAPANHRRTLSIVPRVRLKLDNRSTSPAAPTRRRRVSEDGSCRRPVVP